MSKTLKHLLAWIGIVAFAVFIYMLIGAFLFMDEEIKLKVRDALNETNYPALTDSFPWEEEPDAGWEGK